MNTKQFLALAVAENGPTLTPRELMFEEDYEADEMYYGQGGFLERKDLDMILCLLVYDRPWLTVVSSWAPPEEMKERYIKELILQLEIEEEDRLIAERHEEFQMWKELDDLGDDGWFAKGDDYFFKRSLGLDRDDRFDEFA